MYALMMKTPAPFFSNANSLSQVPVIDMQKLFSKDLKDLEFDKLHLACKEWGFFLLINHGHEQLSTALVENVKLGIQEFFNLPMEEKKKFWQKPDEIEGFSLSFLSHSGFSPSVPNSGF